MKRSFRQVSRRAAIVVLLAGAATIPARAASLIGTTTAGEAHWTAVHFHLHCVSGYYWAAFHDGTTAVLFSSPDGVIWTSQGPIFSSFNPGQVGTWAVRYSGSNIVAVAYRGADTNRYYRNGTLNNDGTVSWAAADASVGVAGAADQPLNVLVANNKPVIWRADLSSAGRFRRGSQLNGPTWSDTPLAPALATATNGSYSGGAIFPTGGPSPDDLIVLRATTATVYALGSHRLVAAKYNAGTDTFDAAWYDVSTLNGGLGADSATTEVRVGTDNNSNKRFAAVRDGSGNLHALYVNRNDDVVHYKKLAGFNDSWSRISTDVTASATAVDKIAVTAVGSNLYLFYGKNDRRVWFRRFDGTTWGPEGPLYDASATDTNDAFMSMETATGCPVGMAFSEGLGPTFNMLFTLGVGDCSALSTLASGSTITVSAPASFELRFNQATGGGIDQFFDLAEDPARANDLAGGVTNYRVLFYDAVFTTWFNWTAGNKDNRLDLLEATSTRVRVRHDSSYQQTITGALVPGLKGIGDYSIYPSGRAALKWVRRAFGAEGWTASDLDFVVHRDDTPGPLNNWTPYSEAGILAPSGPAGSDFLLIQNESGGARTDFLSILHTDWLQAESTDWGTSGGTEDAGIAAWTDTDGTAMAAGTSENINFLTYFKPTSFTSNADSAVTSRSSDYRIPDSLSVLVGGPWIAASENTGGGDDFNEAEAAYVLTLDPTLGLTFRIDGTALNPRYQPFFKIRQWRSLGGPGSVTLNLTPLSAGAQYRADVKPVSDGYFANRVFLHTTLQSFAQVNTPDVGNGTGAAENGMTYAAGRYGAAAQFDSVTDWIRIPVQAGGPPNIELDRGRIEFWYRPNSDHTDNQERYLFDIDNDGVDPPAGVRIRMKKESDVTGTFPNQLTVEVVDSTGTPHFIEIPATNYAWYAGHWVHLAMEWDRVSATDNVRAYLNGVGLVPASPSNGAFPMEPENAAGLIRLGNKAVGAGFWNADGLIDEFTIYSTAGTPRRLAFGGLTTNANEFLADPTRNQTFSLSPVDAAGRGQYLYFGADSEFRGLNIGLATPGQGTVDLQWQFWNGTAWADLEMVGGFGDTTNNLTKSGNVFWQDPPAWAPYSVNGGPDLYYVRAYQVSGAYTTDPVEGLVKTDILLLQYCGDISAAADEFSIAAPIPTAVTLQSFTASGADSAVDLRWSTASELSNLGFHLYRSLSTEGPYERITSSLIPGLGSSPTGATYSYRDGGLLNGQSYYYQLEDVETTGQTERHGPVWAIPMPAAEDGTGEGDSGSEDSGQGSGTTRITYGRPGATSFRIVERGSSYALLELVTPGFYAVPEGDGTVHLEVPGFESRSVPGAPDVPVKRALVEALAGRGVRLASVVASEEVRFDGLRVASADAPAMVVTDQGMVKAGLTRTSRTSRPGFFPRTRARVLEVIFQGETKKAQVELAPLRYNSATGTTVLTQRLLVRLDFTTVDKGERTLGGSRGRRPPRMPSVRRRGLVAELVTPEAGLQAVRYEEVLSSPRGVLSSSLRLSRRGQNVAFHIEPPRAVFAPGSVLYFLSAGSKGNPWGDVVYELEVGKAGTRMRSSLGAPTGPPTAEYLDFKDWEENRFYQAGLLDAPDLWLWDLLVSPVAKSYPFTLSQVSPGSTAAHLTLWLQGASDFEADPDHHLRVSLNGQVVGEVTWDGKVERVIEAEISPGILQEGANTLSLENVGDTAASYSMVFLNRFSLTYPRSLVAEGGLLRGAWKSSGTAEVSGLGGAGFVLDVQDASPQWLSGVDVTSGALSFRVEAGRKYLVVSASSVQRPQVRRPLASRLRNPRTGAEWLLVAPREFLGAAQPLIDLRRSQGLKVKAVSLEEVEQDFGYGEHSPSALKEFLEYAYQSWPRPSLRYVVLLGDGSYDPKDYLKTGVKDRISPYMLKTSYLWTASDPAYGAVNGEDLVPDLAVGRLSAGSVEQAQLLVDKIVAFESAGRTLDGRAVLIADNADRGGSFEADADEIASSVLRQREVEKVYLRDLQGGTRATILAAFDNGPSLVSYVGHGGTAVWASENVFNNIDVANLSAQAQQPLLLTLNCLNGFFHFPPLDSLAEAFLKAEGKGAVAAFSPSGLSVNDAAHLYHKAVLEEIESGRHQRLGDAILAAQNTYANTGAMPELLSIYHLFGDPALRFR